MLTSVILPLPDPDELDADIKLLNTLREYPNNEPFDLVFADAMPGKYEGLHEALLLPLREVLLLHGRCVQRRQEVARHEGMLATFMAKPFNDEGGSGFHLHVSLADQHGDKVTGAVSSATSFVSDKTGGKLDSVTGAVEGVTAKAVDALKSDPPAAT